MSSAFDMFTDSYIKSMKRPELFNFNPDQAYGANLLHGSEKQNPSPNRDQDNAKFGRLGGSTTPVYQQGGGTQPLTGFGDNLSMPEVSTQSPQGSGPLSTLMGMGAGAGVSYGMNKGLDYLKGVFKGVMGGSENLSDMGGGYSKIAEQMTGAPSVDQTAKSIIGDSSKSLHDTITGATDATSSPVGFDPTTLALAAVPQLARLFGLKQDSIGGSGLSAATNIGSAVLQGGLNPISDVGAGMSVVNFIRKLFG